LTKVGYCDEKAGLILGCHASVVFLRNERSKWAVVEIIATESQCSLRQSENRRNYGSILAYSSMATLS